MAINAGQIRAARALIDWSQDVLADRSGVSKSTLQKIETGLIAAPRVGTLDQIQEAFFQAGVEFSPNSGVRLKDPGLITLEGDAAYGVLLDDVYNTLRVTGGDICIFGLVEDKVSSVLQMGASQKFKHEKLLAHIERLKQEKIRERLLVCEGDHNFLAPQHWYRWMPKEYFEPTPIYVYGTKMAVLYLGEPFRAVIYNNPEIAASMRKIFDFVWSRSEPARTAEQDDGGQR
jgi:transcriptional regulator with XRE-family HTH domain